MRFLHPERDRQLELSLEDCFLVPGYFEGGSRLEVDLSPTDFAGSAHPMVSANMNAVTGKRMAETMARTGGLGVLPQDMELATVERIVRHLKAADPRFDTPLVVSPSATLRDVEGIIRKRAHDMVAVADDAGRLLGVITSADLRAHDQYTPAGRLMSQTLVTLEPEVDLREAFLRMEKERVKAAPVVDEGQALLGILTREDAVRRSVFSPSLDAQGRLMVAAAIGIGEGARERAAALLEVGVDVLVLDTAHGHQRRMLEALREVAPLTKGQPLVAGNVCTGEGAAALFEAGADIAKVNVGPGAMCTTRMQTGAGRPTFSSALACAEEARRRGKHIWADGGVRHPRDVALYLAAGASRVMIGTMLAGTYESPGDLKQDAEGRLFKVNYGMASARAVSDRTADLDPFERAKKALFREGISHSRIYVREGEESVTAILMNLLSGLSSAHTYVGARGQRELWERAVVGVQTASGYGEGTPHGQVRGQDAGKKIA